MKLLHEKTANTLTFTSHQGQRHVLLRLFYFTTTDHQSNTNLTDRPPLPHPTWILLLVHESHDVLHEMPALLRILGRLGLLHQVRYLDLATRERREHDPHLLQDGDVLTVTEVQCVNVKSRRSERLS